MVSRSFFYEPLAIFPVTAQTNLMKLTTIICCSYLAFIGLIATVFALSGFNLLLFLCAGNVIVYRALLSLSGVAAGWLIFWLIAFRPTSTLS